MDVVRRVDPLKETAELASVRGPERIEQGWQRLRVQLHPQPPIPGLVPQADQDNGRSGSSAPLPRSG
jgi:hypothetical protein